MKLFRRLASMLSGPTQPTDLPNLEAAIKLLDEGVASKALELIERLLVEKPQDGKLQFFHGNALMANQRPLEALEAYKRALEIKPDSAGAYFNMGNAFGALEMRNEQLQAYRTATALKNGFFDAELALGDLLERMKRPTEALTRFKNAVDIDPGSLFALTRYGKLLINTDRNEQSESLCNDAIHKLRSHLTQNTSDAESLLLLGHLYLALDSSSEDALKSYLEVTKKQPDNIEALNNIGAIWKNRGDLQRAYSYYKYALSISPKSHEIHSNIGTLLMNIGRLDEAISHLKSAVSYKPDFAEGHCNLGLAYFRNLQYEEAIGCFRTSLDLDSNLYSAANNLGSSLLKTGKTEEARQALLRAIEIDPSIDDAYSNLAGVYLDQGEHSQAADLYRKAVDLNPKATIAFSNLLFCHNYTRALPKDDLYEEARAYGRVVTQLAKPFQEWQVSPDPQKKIRVGLLSADFYSHPVGYFLESIASELEENYDDRLDLIGFYNNWICDDITRAIQGSCSEWHLIFHLDDKQTAQLIREKQIDILIELSGHTGRNRLPVLAWRPAPVQISWLGYFATTGVTEIDFLLADPYALPAAEEKFFSEKIRYLPDTRLCFSVPAIDIAVNDAPVLTQKYITFGCFNALPKITDEVVKVWATLLASLPGSKLLLKARQLGEQQVQESVYERFARFGITRERLSLLPPSDRKSYLETYRQIDIALDPFPYTGGTTTVEALWMGVPVLTLAGDSLLSRQGVGMLSNVGITDWIAVDIDDYIAKAITHAKNPECLALLRKSLRQKLISSPLCNAQLFCHHFTNTLRDIWEQHCEEQSLLNNEQSV